MNRKGFIDFDDLSLGMIILPVVGFLMGVFTAAGGFSSMFMENTVEVGFGTRILAGILGALIGLGIAWYMSNN